MGANRVGQLYRYKHDLPTWNSPEFFQHEFSSGLVLAQCPFIILSKTWRYKEQWISVLYEEEIRFINVSYIDLEWIDPECYFDINK